LLVNGEKMSKSLGNFLTVRDIIGRGPWAGQAFRFFLLKTRYRNSIDFSFEALHAAKAELSVFYNAIGKSGATRPADPRHFGTNELSNLLDIERESLCDDLNTAQLFADLHATVRQAQKGQKLAGEVLLHAGELLGLFQDLPEVWHEKARHYILRAEPGRFRLEGQEVRLTLKRMIADEQIVEAITFRNAARKAKNWAEADRIRDELKAKGIILEDGAGGTTWKRA